MPIPKLISGLAITWWDLRIMIEHLKTLISLTFKPILDQINCLSYNISNCLMLLRIKKKNFMIGL